MLDCVPPVTKDNAIPACRIAVSCRLPPHPAQAKVEPGLTAKLLRNLRPSHQHSAFSATLLLMTSVMLARVIGYLREMYVAWAFGAGPKTDAYVAAFTIPDFLFYILAGGTASITFISIYARHTAKGEERQAQQAFNSTITIMTAVTLAGNDPGRDLHAATGAADLSTDSPPSNWSCASI